MGRSVWGCCHRVLSASLLYGSLALFTSILHNVFLLYYVETFVSVYKIDKVSFWVGEVSAQPSVCVILLPDDVMSNLSRPQTVFLLWNSLNDPLFGWLSDRAFLSSPQ